MNPPDTAAPDQLVLDARVLGAMFGDDFVVIASVLKTFLASTGENLPALALAAATHNFDSVAALAHKIAGACRMSGAQALGLAACRVEVAAKRGDAASVLQGMTNLQTQWTLIQAAIDNLINIKQP